jgi:NAD(P)-dependent dehydrogenase (short-subunit alcohol dehydrogenase family)
MAGERGTVVVTGGTGGLGRGVTRAMLDAGHRVVVTWVVERERDAAQEAFGETVSLRRVDVTEPVQVESLAAELGAAGEPWAVAHLVGGYHDGDPFADLDLEAWEVQFRLNVRSLAVVLCGFLGGMIARGGGRVVAVSSRTALRPFAGAGAYAASKAAVISAVQAASEEVKAHGVCVNCVLPSVIDTPANRAAMPDADHSRWVRPEEIGAVVRFLCSPEASAVTGAAIPVYGRA